MIAAAISFAFVAFATILALSIALHESGKRHTAELQATVDRASENMNLMFSQLAESRRNEAKTAQDMIDLQTSIIKSQQKTINKLHTRMTMEEAQAAADLNGQYASQQPTTIPVTANDPYGHVPSGWSDPQAALLDLPDESVVVPRDEEPIDL